MPTLGLADLNGFTGCDQWTRHWLNRNIIYSEGMAYVAEHAGGGAFWLIDAIASHEAGPMIAALRQADSDFDYLHFWYLTVDTERHTAVLECRLDSEQPAVVAQEIEYTDFDLGSIKLYVAVTEGSDGNPVWVIMLPSEY